MGDGQSSEYETDDEVLLIAHNKETHSHIGAKYTVTGSSKAQTLYLKEIPYKGDDTTSNLMSVLASNTDASNAYYVKIYDFVDCQLLSHIEVPTSNSIPVYYGGRGVRSKPIFEIENKAIIVTANFR